MSIANTRYLVETDWLETHLDDPNLRILDCTTFVRASEDGYYIDNPDVIIIDALTRQEYSGELAVYGRSGHIPSSINIPAIELVDRRTRSYLPVEKLEEIFAPILEENLSGIITYCGGAAAGSSVAFALKLLGVENVSVYDGALIEWASDPDLPMVT